MKVYAASAWGDFGRGSDHGRERLAVGSDQP